MKAPNLPSDLDDQFRDALGAMARADYERAKKFLATILERAPLHIPSQKKMAAVLHQQLDFIGAEAAYRKILSITPRDVEALHGLATSLHEAGRVEEAIEIYDTVLAVNPGKVATLSNL